jgi:hypothetical protein
MEEEEVDRPAVDTVTAAEQLMTFSPDAEVDLVETEDKLIKSDGMSELVAPDCLDSKTACLDFLDF